jgi:hypothetical protein
MDVPVYGVVSNVAEGVGPKNDVRSDPRNDRPEAWQAKLLSVGVCGRHDLFQ